MKSSRMLMLFVIAVANVVNATNLKPFLQGQLVDEKGQTIYHKMAKNCTRKKYFEQQMVVATLSVIGTLLQDSDQKKENSTELDEHNQALRDIPEELLILMPDKNGKTARDYAKEMYKLTRCRDCADLAFKLEDLEKEVLNKVDARTLKKLEEVSEKMAAQNPNLSEDGAQPQ
jgi:hypothetical protein